ncbi:MAG: hypothetical protein JNM66_28695 [Bryobacterales bacterium]|nr:hypothetical protein [Bryobacterales bacterium]
MILGISVSEERQTVERFLKEHPHLLPTVSTSENEMPRAYQVGIFPTYVVTGKDGKLAAAMEGGPGSGLRTGMVHSC